MKRHKTPESLNCQSAGNPAGYPAPLGHCSRLPSVVRFAGSAMQQNRRPQLKHLALVILLVIFMHDTSSAQLKEAAQLATLTPTLLVVTSSDVIHAHKLHSTVSTVAYLGSYMVTGSTWKAMAITLFLGAAKELIYDGLMNRGEPWIQDMKWNALGVAQGTVFTLSLRF
jgi:hypothetical protein